MKKIFVALALLLIVGIFIFLSDSKKDETYVGFETTEYQLEGHSLKLLVADSKRKWEMGLMEFRELEGDIDGMIFKFPEKDYRTFWNLNTYLDLTVYWIDGDQVVGKSKLPSIEKSDDIVTVSSPKPVDTVVEIIE